MPYIDPQLREHLTPAHIPTTAGELNFVLTVVCLQYMRRQGVRYQQINDIVGALESCKLEFYRRLAAGYEDDMIVKNGDVY